MDRKVPMFEDLKTDHKEFQKKEKQQFNISGFNDEWQVDQNRQWTHSHSDKEVKNILQNIFLLPGIERSWRWK